ncbi:uncharacterized protein JCM6883_000997 [Sporobolomyces salmoneus]|uniref:uncharacterized protein n=1 Tax=Sporobolomyces salmoneus TaxID=183962 RepID=UPI00316CC71F
MPRRVPERDIGPPPIHTPTVQLGLSQPIKVAIQSRLFFHSEQWITPLYKDINALLNQFEHRWEIELQHQIAATGGEEGTREMRSPFELFKQLWKEKGWSLIHLLGVTDGPLRAPWGESVLRGFAEHLNSKETPLRQIGALFAIFIFCKTQPSSTVQQCLKIDIPTLEYLTTFPVQVSPFLDPTDSSPLSPPPSHDVTTVLASLLSPTKPLFYLIPTELYLHPPNLPTVLIRDARSAERHRGGMMDRIGQKLLGIEEEIEWLRRGKVEGLEKLRKRVEKKAMRKREKELQRRENEAQGIDQSSDQDEEDEEEDEEADEEEEVMSSRARTRGIAEDWIGNLSKTSRTYSTSKTGGGGSVFKRPKSQLQLEVMKRAEEATMRKVRETGLEQTVERRIGGSTDGQGQRKKRLLNLVEGFDELSRTGGRVGSKKKRRRGNDSIRELDSALTLLQKSYE